jgi:hypothetical protein
MPIYRLPFASQDLVSIRIEVIFVCFRDSFGHCLPDLPLGSPFIDSSFDFA